MLQYLNSFNKIPFSVTCYLKISKAVYKNVIVLGCAGNTQSLRITKKSVLLLLISFGLVTLGVFHKLFLPPRETLSSHYTGIELSPTEEGTFIFTLSGKMHDFNRVHRWTAYDTGDFNFSV